MGQQDMQVVLIMGNPWVTQAQPVSHPAKPIPTHVGCGIFWVWVWVPVGLAGKRLTQWVSP